MRVIIILIVLFLSVPQAIAQPITLVTLGDSLTVGDGDEIGGGYPRRLLALLQRSYPGSTLNNLAQSGWTSQDLINTQLAPAVNLLRSAPVANLKIAVVWIGSNDLFGLYNWVCDNDYGNNYLRCEADDRQFYRENINQIVRTLKATGARVYIALLDNQSRRPVMTDPALRNSSFDRITATDVQRMSLQVLHYNNIIRNAASTIGAVMAYFFNTTIFETWATLSEDGNHPNAAGYNQIADIWYQVIS